MRTASHSELDPGPPVRRPAAVRCGREGPGAASQVSGRSPAVREAKTEARTLIAEVGQLRDGVRDGRETQEPSTTRHSASTARLTPTLSPRRTLVGVRKTTSAPAAPRQMHDGRSNRSIRDALRPTDAHEQPAEDASRSPRSRTTPLHDVHQSVDKPMERRSAGLAGARSKASAQGPVDGVVGVLQKVALLDRNGW